MLVPLPTETSFSATGPSGSVEKIVSAPASDARKESSKGWSTGGKLAAGAAGVVAVGGAAMGGAILGDHIAEHGLEATVDAAGDGLADAGEAVEDFAVDAGEFMV